MSLPVRNKYVNLISPVLEKKKQVHIIQLIESIAVHEDKNFAVNSFFSGVPLANKVQTITVKYS